MATKVNSEKKVDMPPRGDRNADPITNAPGFHPIETGIGAAVGGAASGMAVGGRHWTGRCGHRRGQSVQWLVGMLVKVSAK